MANEPESVVGGRGQVASCALEERQVGELTVLAVRGTLDVLTTPELDTHIAAISAKSPTGLVIDLSAVDFLGSSGMGALVAAHSALTPTMRFALVADGPVTLRPLKLVGIADIIDIFTTLDEALSALSV